MFRSPPPFWSQGDPYWGNRILLLHGDGTNGSTNIVDSSSYNHVRGSAGGDTPLSTLTTTSPKFGSASMTFDSAGTGGLGPRYTGSEFETASKDFKVEGWVWLANYGANHCICQYGSASTSGQFNYCVIIEDTYKKIGFGGFNGSVYNFDLLSSTAISLNTWYHFACTGVGTTRSIYVNGSLEATGTATGTAPTLTTPTMYVGRGRGTYFLGGKLDDFRLTIGVNEPVAVPTGPYPEG